MDLGGIPCDYHKIFEVVESKKHLFHPENKIQPAIGRVIVMADAAHAFGLTWYGQPVRLLQTFQTLVFMRLRISQQQKVERSLEDYTGINDEDIYQYQLRSLHGQSKDALAKTQLGAWEYDIIGTWYKCNMTDVIAGIGLAQRDIRKC